MSIICGASNNQIPGGFGSIEEQRLPPLFDVLRDRKILYVPDFLANAGGVITVAAQLEGVKDQDILDERINFIYNRASEILETAEERNVSTVKVAEELALERINPDD